MMDLKRLHARMDAMEKKLEAKSDPRDAQTAFWKDRAHHFEAAWNKRCGELSDLDAKFQDMEGELAKAREALKHDGRVCVALHDAKQVLYSHPSGLMCPVCAALSVLNADAPAEPKQPPAEPREEAPDATSGECESCGHTAYPHGCDVCPCECGALCATSDEVRRVEVGPVCSDCGGPHYRERADETLKQLDILQSQFDSAIAQRDHLRAELEKTRAEVHRVQRSAGETIGHVMDDLAEALEERDAANALLRRVAANTEHAVEHDALVSEIRTHLGVPK